MNAGFYGLPMSFQAWKTFLPVSRWWLGGLYFFEIQCKLNIEQLIYLLVCILGIFRRILP